MDSYALVFAVCATFLFASSLAYFVFSAFEWSYAVGKTISHKLHQYPGDIWNKRLGSLVFADLILPALPLTHAFVEKNRFNVHLAVGALDRKLSQAGLRQELSPEHLLALSLTSALTVGTLSVLLGVLLGSSLPATVILFLPTGVLTGSILPSFVLQRIVNYRLSLINKRLPFAVEFMLLVMEANPAFSGAIRTYCNEMGDEPLANELGLVMKDVGLGKSLEEALSRMEARIRSPFVTNFLLALRVGLETGQPIKDIMKIQADVTRQQRYNAAEEIAKAASTEAVFPLIAVAMALVILLVVPLLIRAAQGSFF